MPRNGGRFKTRQLRLTRTFLSSEQRFDQLFLETSLERAASFASAFETVRLNSAGCPCLGGTSEVEVIMCGRIQSFRLRLRFRVNRL